MVTRTCGREDCGLWTLVRLTGLFPRLEVRDGEDFTLKIIALEERDVGRHIVVKCGDGTLPDWEAVVFVDAEVEWFAPLPREKSRK